jgi:hypothetical protein
MAGATESGRPYFVMELVRGIRITEYCDQQRFPARRRLDLFIQVCQAVQHAHQKGIIHRDLKPSNILVTECRRQPVPKIIDFGIAKAVSGRLTDQTLFTAFEQLIGTPAYMSPEQAALNAAGHRHAERHLQPGGAALRVADRRDALRHQGAPGRLAQRTCSMTGGGARHLQHEPVLARHLARAARPNAHGRNPTLTAMPADMYLAQQALKADDLGKARTLLDRYRPGTGREQLRGWEWRFLWQECRSDALGELCRFSKPAFRVAYSPDGSRLAIAGYKREFIEMWDVPAHRRIAILQTNTGRVVAFSAKGDLLATDTVRGTNWIINIWQVGSANLVHQITNWAGAHSVGPVALKFSPDGTQLMSLNRGGNVARWKSRTGNGSRIFRRPNERWMKAQWSFHRTAKDWPWGMTTARFGFLT